MGLSKRLTIGVTMLASLALGADIETTASASGSVAFVEYLSAPGPGFFVQFAPLPKRYGDSADLAGVATGSSSGFFRHNAARERATL